MSERLKRKKRRSENSRCSGFAVMSFFAVGGARITTGAGAEAV